MTSVADISLEVREGEVPGLIHPDGEEGVSEGEEAQESYRLLEGHKRF